MKIYKGDTPKFSHVCKREFDDKDQKSQLMKQFLTVGHISYSCCFDGIGKGFCEGRGMRVTFVPRETLSLDTKFCCCVVPGLWTLVIQLSLSASLIKCPLSPSACYTFASNTSNLCMFFFLFWGRFQVT